MVFKSTTMGIPTMLFSVKDMWWFLKQKAGSGNEPTRPGAKAPKALAKKDVAGDLAESLGREKSDGPWEEGLSGPPQPTLSVSRSFSGRGGQRSRLALSSTQLFTLGI